MIKLLNIFTKPLKHEIFEKLKSYAWEENFWKLDIREDVEYLNPIRVFLSFHLHVYFCDFAIEILNLKVVLILSDNGNKCFQMFSIIYTAAVVREKVLKHCK
ncbi:hypothetical protein Pfo_031402 [Paulownia fortunei]|nr:hypothetical protein Pfo_031402 [Paulownia fortunei]